MESARVVLVILGFLDPCSCLGLLAGLRLGLLGPLALCWPFPVGLLVPLLPLPAVVFLLALPWLNLPLPFL